MELKDKFNTIQYFYSMNELMDFVEKQDIEEYYWEDISDRTTHRLFDVFKLSYDHAEKEA